MSVVIIEGCDGSGKSTLAEEFVQRGYKYLHHSHTDLADPSINAFEFYTRQLLVARDQRVVFDRFYPSELVYGPVMRGASRITLEQMHLLNRLLYALGGAVIFCEVPFDLALSHWQSRRGAEYVSEGDQLRQIHDAYRRLRSFEFACGNAFTYDHTKLSVWPTLRGDLRQYVEYLEKYNQCFDLGVIGNHHMGKFLFVGEQSDQEWDLAFYGNSKSAGFLTSCLWEAGYREPEMAFTNALTFGGEPRDIRTIYAVRPKVVVALGKTAARTCFDQGVPHLEAPHPQYIKRFKLAERDQYVNLLRRFRNAA